MIKIVTQNETGHSVFTDDEIKQLENYLKDGRLDYIISKLNILDNDIKQSTNPQILFKARLIELSSIKKVENNVEGYEKNAQVVSATDNKDYIPLINDLTERIRDLEDEVDELKKNGVSVSTVSTGNSVEIVDKAPKLKEFRDFKKLQNEIKNKKQLKLLSSLVLAKAYVDGDTIIFKTDNNFIKSVIEEAEAKEILEDTILEITGKDYNIVVELNEKEETEDPFEERLNEFDVDYEEF